MVFNKLLKNIKDKLQKPSLLINAMSNWGSLATNILVGFLLTPYIITNVGKTGYGIWTLISSIIGYYGLLDLGVSSAIVRFVSLHLSQNNIKLLKQTISTTFYFLSFLGLAIIGLSFGLSVPIGKFFHVSPNQFGEFCSVIWLLGLSAGMGLPGNLFAAVLRGSEHFVAVNSVTIAVTLLRALLTVLMLSLGFGLLGIAYCTIITSALSFVLNFLVCNRLIKNMSFGLADVNLPVLGTLLSYGTSTTVIVLADSLRFKMDTIVVGKMVGLPAVAVYSIAAILLNYMMAVIVIGIDVLRPRFVALDGKGEHDKLRQLFRKSLFISSVLSYGLGTLLVIFGPKFINLWVGPEFLEVVPVLWILVACSSVGLSQTPGVTAMFALNKHHFYAAASLIEGIVKVILSIILAKPLGIIGVALGTAISMAVMKIVIQPIYVSKIIGISMFQYWREQLPSLLLAVLLILANFYLPRIRIFGDGFLSLFTGSLPYLGAFFLLYYVFNIIEGRRFVSNKSS